MSLLGHILEQVIFYFKFPAGLIGWQLELAARKYGTGCNLTHVEYASSLKVARAVPPLRISNLVHVRHILYLKCYFAASLTQCWPHQFYREPWNFNAQFNDQTFSKEVDKRRRLCYPGLDLWIQKIYCTTEEEKAPSISS